MKEITKWIANDGTEFQYEDDCREHEFNTEVVPLLKKCRAYDQNFIPIPVDSDFAYNFERVFYLYVDSEESFEVFDKISEQMGYVSPKETCDWENDNEEGIFLYYQDNDCWCDIDKEITRFQDMIKRMSKK